MRMIASGGYPWESDPLVDNAWVADARYLDSLVAVSVWSPNKGTIPLVQPSAGLQASYSATYGSRNKGSVVSDSGNDWMSGDALAAQVSDTHAFTMIESFDLLAVADSATTWGFGSTGASSKICLFQIRVTSNKWATAYYDNLGNISLSESDVVATTGRIVVTTLMGASIPGHSRIRINGVERTIVNTQIPASPGIGDTDFTKFTSSAWRGTSAIQCANVKLRTRLFARSILPPSSYLAHEAYLVPEAA